MDRLNQLHRNARVELPASVIGFEPSDGATGIKSRFPLVLPRYLGLIGFMTCGAFVVASASLLALSL